MVKNNFFSTEELVAYGTDDSHIELYISDLLKFLYAKAKFP